MRNQFYVEINNWYENIAVRLLNKALPDGYTCKRNNETSNDIDLIIFNQGIPVGVLDVQYSFNFAKYGDVRLDFVSASQKLVNEQIDVLNKELRKQKNQMEYFNSVMKVKKYGKFFQENHKYPLLGVFYFLYEKEKPKSWALKDAMDVNQKIDKIVFLPNSDVQLDLKKESKNYKIYINDKESNNLKDDYESAFLTIDLRKFVKVYKLPVILSQTDPNFKILGQKIVEEIHKNIKQDVNTLNLS